MKNNKQTNCSECEKVIKERLLYLLDEFDLNKIECETWCCCEKCFHNFLEVRLKEDI